jgi:hypothetical protein
MVGWGRHNASPKKIIQPDLFRWRPDHSKLPMGLMQPHTLSVNKYKKNTKQPRLQSHVKKENQKKSFFFPFVFFHLR